MKKFQLLVSSPKCLPAEFPVGGHFCPALRGKQSGDLEETAAPGWSPLQSSRRGYRCEFCTHLKLYLHPWAKQHGGVGGALGLRSRAFSLREPHRPHLPNGDNHTCLTGLLGEPHEKAREQVFCKRESKLRIEVVPPCLTRVRTALSPPLRFHSEFCNPALATRGALL